MVWVLAPKYRDEFSVTKQKLIIKIEKFFQFKKILIFITYRIDKSSRRRYSIDMTVLKNFPKFTRIYLCQSLFFNKVAGLRPVAQMLSCEFCEIFKYTFLTVQLRWLLLKKQENPVMSIV